TGADGSACRKGAGQIRHTLGVNRVHQGGQTARPGGDHSSALGGAARHPDSGRVRAGLRGKCIFWDRRSAEHTSGDRREAQPGNQRGALQSKDQGAPRRDGRYGACRDACRFQQAHRRRNGEMGQGDPGRQHQGGMKRRFTGISERDVMKLPRRKFLHGAGGAGGLPSVSRIARAQDRQSRPVRIIVGFTAGSATDITARLFAQKLNEAWKTPVTVENIPGAGGSVGAERVAKSAPDGSTLYWGANGAMTINPSLQPSPAFDPARDLAPIARVLVMASILAVNNEVPAKSVAELFVLAKAQPGKLSFASPGVGTPQHIAGELLKSLAGVDIVHVPYRGAVLTDVISGRVTMTLMNMGAILP